MKTLIRTSRCVNSSRIYKRPWLPPRPSNTSPIKSFVISYITTFHKGMTTMEIKTRFVLKHQNGPYLSWDREQFPHTWKLSNARRFYKIEEISDFLSNSYYKPENPDEYEVIEIEIEYRLKEADGNERMQTSIHAGMDGRTEIAHEDG